MIIIDGSVGEGGGQILRTALSLSLCTGQAFRMVKIRAGRSKPGLMRQHLTAVQAAAQIGGADISAVGIGATELQFSPGKVRAGDYSFSVGTAGSATLVFETVLPALITASGGKDGNVSNVVCQGGTHNPYAPPYDFLERAFAPQLQRLGVGLDLELIRTGYYPAGGGEFRARIAPPSGKLAALSLMERGALVSRSARVDIACLASHIGVREMQMLQSKLNWPAESFQIREVTGTLCPGNTVLIEEQYENVTELVTGFGERGTAAEKVAEMAVDRLRRYSAAASDGAVVGDYLTDQLLVPMALAGRGEFLAVRPSRHSITNKDTIRRFLDVDITFTERTPLVWECRIG
ncbi:MAG: RNA 3'-terminal phosphate cyclase [Candidatus Methylacidiphilales bacterium]|nr:RNA 3'-terminal phosphate cyclase [Candidatus Methylacidiphilales bacterium]